MITTNVIRIGKGIRNILELDNNNSSGLIVASSFDLKLRLLLPCILLRDFTCLVRDRNLDGLLSDTKV